MITPERIFVVCGAIVAVLLQLVAAPYIAIGPAMPNFPVAFAMTLAIVRAHKPACLLPFLLGLAFDLVGGGPMGAMAFSLTLFCYLLAWFVGQTGNDSPFMCIAFIALGLLFVEVAYCVFLLVFGYNVGIFEALAYRVAPCFVYDLAVSVLIYFIARRIVQPAGVVRTDITQLR